LCLPASKDTLAPAVCGSHQNLRIQGFWLTIIRLPKKSMNDGLTWMAA